MYVGQLTKEKEGRKMEGGREGGREEEAGRKKETIYIVGCCKRSSSRLWALIRLNLFNLHNVLSFDSRHDTPAGCPRCNPSYIFPPAYISND